MPSLRRQSSCCLHLCTPVHGRHSAMNERPHNPLVKTLLWRAAGLSIAWLVLAGMHPSSWLIGVPAVALAAYASVTLAPVRQNRVVWRALPRFLTYFLFESLRGGIDVAARTLTPTMRVHPGQIRYTSQLPHGAPTVLFAGCVSLLPGTLSVKITDNTLDLHVLDSRIDATQDLRALETRIAALLGTTQEVRHA